MNAVELKFRIRGMDCAEEVATLKAELGPLVGGGDRLAFDILNGKMTVLAQVSPDAVVQAVARTGMTAERWTEQKTRAADETIWERWGRTILTGASGAATLAGFALHAKLAGRIAAALGSEGMGAGHEVPVPVRAVYFVGVASGTWIVLPKAWVALRRLRPDMNLLMCVAVVGAIGLGEWFEASTVAFLFALSLSLEAWSVGRARRAVATLLELAPARARVRKSDGSVEDVASESVAVGSAVLVKPGDRIPLDGRVVEGTSAIDQAPVTGESVPVPKSPGDDVFAGTINGDGALTIETTKPAGDTVLSRIIQMVGEAQSRRAHSEQWVERFAAVYTPVVMIVALVLLLVPPLVFGKPWNDWVYRSLVLLVIACPCALVISTPVSIVAALAAAARHGVLVKGGVHIETPATIAAIALDKTGTLTQGKPRVVEIVGMIGHDEREVLEIAAAMEAQSTHPLARAVMEHVKEKGISVRPVENFQVLQGKGATARLDGQNYWVGSHRYLEEKGEETPEVHERLEAMARAGRTILILGNDQHVCGFIALADAIRPETRKVVEDLRRAGVRHVVMLTGDNKGTAAAIGREAGIDEIKAELLPGDKVEAIAALVEKYGRVAMVGDGVNDAPALARATLGIAMGAAGTDAAIETADIALMSDDLSKLPWLIEHSRRTLAVVRQNISFSLGVKAVFVALTFTGHASLWSAIAADMGASLLVIFNGLRLLGGRPGASGLEKEISR